MTRPVFVSTTFFGNEPTELAEVLDLLDGLPVDGVELGSTHRWRPDLQAVAKRLRCRIFTHNYFPPARDDLIINLASADADILLASRTHAHACIDAAAAIGAELYTVHPGFLAEPMSAATTRADGAFDFTFAAPAGSYEQAFQTMVESLRQLADHAARSGIGLAIETEGSVTKQGVLLMERPDEYQRLLALLPQLRINLNVAHSSLSASVHGFTLEGLIQKLLPALSAIELSHNDGRQDQHLPLVADSPMLAVLAKLPERIPVILEFRDATRAQVADSIALVRAAASLPFTASSQEPS
jgi:sugar phosphate isomerase/epimerase